jgi:hypothetical protein
MMQAVLLITVTGTATGHGWWAFEPKRVQTVAIHADPLAPTPKFAAQDYRRNFVECTVACPK